MLVQPSKTHCRSFKSKSAAVKAAIRFFTDLIPDNSLDDFNDVHWVVVPVDDECTTWTVLVFITRDSCCYAEAIAEHGWKVTK